jgi:type I restriction enzyme S subunit
MTQTKPGTTTSLTGKWKSYPAYKDSGVEWLGKIPEHWEVQRLKNTIQTCQNGIWGDEPTNDTRDIVCIRVADFDRTRNRVNGTHPTLRSIPLNQRQGRELKSGDLLLEKSGGGELQPVGVVVLYDLDNLAVCSNFIARMPANEGFDSSFLCYLHSMLYSVRVNTRSIKQNTGIQNLDGYAYLCEQVNIPPLPEQHTIATFLDRETAKINTLIAKKERLIELLQEKRAALISQAVTKGLDPTVPMKDSGVEWLGEIPAHWEALQLKRRWRVIDCKHRTATYTDDGIPIVSTTEVKPGRLNLENTRLTSEAEFLDLSEGRLPKRGDIIYSRNASVGSAAYVDTYERFCMGQDVCLITSINQDQLFLSYLLDSSVVRGQLDALMVGSTIQRINVGQIQHFWVNCPPQDEQHAIATYLDHETAKIDALISRIREGIEKLKEYSTALISAAVTGKIDVRGEIAPSDDMDL